MLCTEGSTGCAKIPRYRSGIKSSLGPSLQAPTSIALSKGWHLLSAYLPPPTAQAYSCWKSLSVSASHVVCLTKLPRAEHSAQNDPSKAWPSQSGLLIISRLALCFLKMRVPSTRLVQGNKTGKIILLHICPKIGMWPSSHIHIRIHTWTLWYHQSWIHSCPLREHSDL